MSTSPESFTHSPKEASPLFESKFQASTSFEQISIGIFQRSEQTIFALVTLPTASKLLSLQPIGPDLAMISSQQQVISAYGETSGNSIVSGMNLQPGDYCLGLIFESKEQAEKVQSLRLGLEIETLTNLQLSQMIFGLYRSLGFEPSHVLKYPVRSASSGFPFYRKTRGEIETLTDLVKEHHSEKSEEKWSDQIKSLIQLQMELQSSVQTILDKLSIKSTQDSTMLMTEPEISSPSPDLTKTSFEMIESQLDQLMNQYEKSHQLLSELSKWTQDFNPLKSELHPVCQTLEEIQTQISHFSQQTQTFEKTIFQITTFLENLKSEESNPSSPSEILNELSSIQSQLEKLGSNSDTVPLDLLQDLKTSIQSLMTSSMDQFHEIQTTLSSISTEKLEQSVETVSEKVSHSLNQLDDHISKSFGQLHNQISESVQTTSQTNLNNETIVTSDQIEQLKKQLEAVQASVSSEKGTNHTVNVQELERLIQERKLFYEKLQEAEDYIEKYINSQPRLPRVRSHYS